MKVPFRGLYSYLLTTLLLLTGQLGFANMTHPETTDTTTWIPLFDEPPAPTDGSPIPEEIWENGRLRQVNNPRMGLFMIASKEPRPCVVVCPGGGYGLLSMEKEGYEIAHFFNELGIHAVVLAYRLLEYGYPAPLIDTTRAIRYLRANAADYRIQTDRIGIMGFSAGGHAAALASTLFDSKDSLVGDSLDAISARPDFSILAYPVLSSDDDLIHKGSFRNLLGEDASEERKAMFSLEKRVSAKTPPTFLMHSADDASVPAGNSLAYAKALGEFGIPYSLHIYPSATHGMGMRPGFGSASTWPSALRDWLNEAGLTEARP